VHFHNRFSYLFFRLAIIYHQIYNLFVQLVVLVALASINNSDQIDCQTVRSLPISNTKHLLEPEINRPTKSMKLISIDRRYQDHKLDLGSVYLLPDYS